jgi:hypothetical protein
MSSRQKQKTPTNTTNSLSVIDINTDIENLVPRSSRQAMAPG